MTHLSIEYAIELQLAAGSPGKTYFHGLQFEAAYAFSHALDNASSASLGIGERRGFPGPALSQPELRKRRFDVRQRFVLSYLYDLPFGRGQLFGKTAKARS